MISRRAVDRRQRGAASVEMALVAPLLVLLLMGIIDVGRILFTHVAVQDAAQEGALFASYEPDNFGAVRQRVVTSVEELALNSGEVVVSCPLGPNGDEIDVTVQHDVDLLTPIIGQLVGESVRLTKTVRAHLLTEKQCDAGS